MKMKINDFSLTDEEKIIFSLRSLYEKYGYEQYKMVKFEEYDLYVQNKEFLTSENVITFNDTSGKLMALKPDVTLSIIKNTKDTPQGIRKVYYNENVYRVSKNTKSYKELLQAGLECMGNIDLYCISETLSLAAMSLKLISDQSVLVITDLDVLSYAVSLLTADSSVSGELLRLAGEKNQHGIEALCRAEGISDEKCALFTELISIHDSSSAAIKKLRALLPDCELVDSLEKTLNSLKEFDDMTQVDFSYSGDLNYYNGIVFKGYVYGVPASVLSGGRYDALMSKMGKKSKAIGFAVYLDELEKIFDKGKQYDVDVLLLYSEGADLLKINRKVKELTDSGNCVLALSSVPEKLRYKTLIEL